MASIKKYKTATGTAWRVQYRSPDGRSRTKQGFKTKDAAQGWADQNAVSINVGAWLDPQKSKSRVRDYEQIFFDTKAHLAPGSLKVMERSWRTWVEPTWGDRQVGSIRKSEVQAWLSKNAKQASTIRRAHGILAGILDLAVEDGCAQSNLARGVTLPSKPDPKHVYLTAGQLAALASECSRNAPLVMLLGTTGVRWGEMAGLRAGDVPEIGSRVRLKRSATWVGRDLHVGPLKGREGRTVSMTSDCMKFLREQAKGRGADEWLFTDADGQPMRPLDHHSWFHCAVERLVESGVMSEKITPHGLRHVAAGLMISHGANVKVVQRQLGHKDAAMTLNVYAELFDDDLDQIGVLLQESFSNAVGLSWDRDSVGMGKAVQRG